MGLVTLSSEVVLRDMTVADLAQVLSIEIAAFPCPWSLHAFRTEVQNPLAWTRVATDDEGRVVAYLVARFYGDMWHLMDLAVCQSARLRGIGRSMIIDLFAVVAATDLDVTLEVRPSNKAAVDLYRGCGFEAVGMRRRYYEDHGEDAIVMLRTGTKPS
ncbi:MAG: ribosomal protein S18-alanine N-acetyltransferase [Thermoleophilia bacterium]|nr:ribosomal protein S18-alanine N-acetyltransferase [Thermoleophilia bacterium]